MQLGFIWSHFPLPGLGKPRRTNISPLSSGCVPGSQVDRPHTGREEVAEGCHLHPGQARQGDSSWYTELMAVFTLLEEILTAQLYIEVIPPPLQSLTLPPSLTTRHVSTSTKRWMPLPSGYAEGPRVSSITRAPGPLGESCTITVLRDTG